MVIVLLVMVGLAGLTTTNGTAITTLQRPEAAAAVVELLTMCVRMLKTC
jgi:hypothetical protein